MVDRCRLFSVVLALCALPFLATSARAADYCVGAAPGCVGTDEGTDLQKALDDAQAHTGNDRVLIGPGTYSRSGGFSYSDNNSINTIEVRGGKKLVLGRARYDLAPGTTARRRVGIGRAGRRLLRTRPRITAIARTTAAHASLTLLRARRS